jgi:hypothetical protein
MLLLDAELSRKERGHRGVRPCHPRADRAARREEQRVPQTTRDRVFFCWRVLKSRLDEPGSGAISWEPTSFRTALQALKRTRRVMPR